MQFSDRQRIESSLFRWNLLDSIGHEWRGSKNAMTFKALWEKRPEWGGMILEMMKNNQPVHLCVGGIDVWYWVLFYTCF